jgi:hypothetical protein
MATEILAVTPEVAPQPKGTAPADTDKPVSHDQPASNLVSQDLTIISKKRRRFRLR